MPSLDPAATSNYLDAIKDSLTEGVIAIKPNGEIVDINSAALAMLGFGRTEDALIDLANFQGLFELRDQNGDMLPFTESPLSRAMLGDTFSGYFLDMRRKDTGREVCGRYTSAPVKDHNGDPVLTVVTIEDVTEREIAEKSECFFHQLKEQTRTLLDPDKVMHVAITMLAEYLKTPRCIYADVDSDKTMVTQTNLSGNGEQPVATQVSIAGFGAVVIDQLRSGRTVAVNDVTKDKRTVGALETYRNSRIGSFVTVPIIKEDHWTAILSVIPDLPREWTHQEIAVIELVTERAWLHMQNARLQREVIQDAARQRLFFRDVLLSVTDGKLKLCATMEDLPLLETIVSPLIHLTKTVGLSALRHYTNDAAESLRMAEDRRHDLILAVGEAAMNAVVHAEEGLGQVYVCGQTSVQVKIWDQGKGIDLETLPKATLSRGFSTKHTLGHGFKMILETMDRVSLLTGLTGTTVILEKDVSNRSFDWP